MDERIYNIVAKEMSGEISAEEHRELEAWIAEDNRNRQDYEEIKRLWADTDDVLLQPTVDTTAAWQKVMAATIEKEKPVQKPKAMAFPAWGKYALSAAAILLVAVLVWKPFGQGEMITVVADNGNKELVLPDNSVVTLRKGSSLRYPKSFSKTERHVALTGEAFFDVARNEQSPFTIDAAAAVVTVLGTSFNVDCANDAATVTVTTGKVRMASAKQIAKSVILTPGEQGILQKDELTETTADDNYLYWMTGVINFDNKPLHSIVKDLSLRSKTTVEFAGDVPQAVKDQAITINFEKQPLEDMLTELCMIASCRWSKENNGYVISVNK